MLGWLDAAAQLNSMLGAQKNRAVREKLKKSFRDKKKIPNEAGRLQWPSKRSCRRQLTRPARR